MKYLILFILFTACNNHSKNNGRNNQLSVLIFSDSAKIYSGTITDKSYAITLAIQKEGLTRVFKKNIVDFGDELVVLLKVSGQAGTLGQAGLIMNWLKESGISNFKISDPGINDKEFFAIDAIDWSQFAKPLDLAMPKEMDEKASEPDKNTLAAILFASDSIYGYWGPDMRNAKIYSITGDSSFGNLIERKQKELGGKLNVRLKPTAIATYKTTVDALDQMTIHKIRTYSMLKLSHEEEIFFSTGSPQINTSGHKVETTILPEARPYLLIMIKANGDISYIYADDTLMNQETPITPSTTEKIYLELNNIEKKHTVDLHKIKLLIKGDKEARYPDFEKLINALKKKEIYKYDLVTNSDQTPK